MLIPGRHSPGRELLCNVVPKPVGQRNNHHREHGKGA